MNLFEIIRSKLNVSDIVRQKVNLAKRHNEHIGLCPFHSEKTPSFTVNDAKQFYHCFGCGAHGDVIKFVAETSGLKYREAAIKLAREHNIPIPKFSPEQKREYDEAEHIKSVVALAQQFFRSHLTDEVKKYLTRERGISQAMIDQFDIGYAPAAGGLINFMESKSISLAQMERAGLISKKNNEIYEIFRERIIFPIRDIYKSIVGFGGRSLKGKMPKYLNSPETLIFQKSKLLFNEDMAISAGYKSGYMILAEGYIDVIALNQIGLDESVASLGTAVSVHHIEKIWKYVDNIIVALDGDEAGQRASKKIIDMALAKLEPKKNVYFLMMPAGKDPADIILASGGSVKFKEILENKKDLSQAIWDYECALHNTSTPGGKASLQQQIESYTAKIPNPTVQKHYGRFFKDKIWNSFFKYKKSSNISNSSAQHLAPKESISALANLEGSLLHLIIHYPHLVGQRQVEDFINKTSLQDKDLQKILEIASSLLCREDTDKEFDMENLKSEIQEAGLARKFDILLNAGKNQLDVNESILNQQKILLYWEVILNKYQTELLKLECLKILNSGSDKANEALNFYKSEIIKNTQNLESLHQKLYKA